MRLGLKSAPQGDPHEVAAHWLTLEDEGRLSGEDRAGLERWLDADPAHRAAYDDARRACEAAARHAADPQIMALRAAALAVAPERSTPLRRIAAAAAIAAVVGGGSWLALSNAPGTEPSPLAVMAASLAPGLHPNTAVYRTAVGERSTFTLPDGSVATLNTGSLLKIAYTPGERGVRLLRGQALFEVAHNKQRPFQVYAGDRRITAVGTVFDVRLDGARVKVALVEGVVRVAHLAPKQTAGPAPTPVQQVVMTAGEVLDAAPSAAMTVRTADTGRATSWRAGVVVFDDEPLAAAVAEVNRYTTHPLVIADPSIGGLRVSGVFKTGDPERFARTMTDIFPVAVGDGPDGSEVLRRRSP